MIQEQENQHFVTGGSDYADYRPTYPDQLADVLASSSLGTQLAVDVGCGTGQLSALLAKKFKQVIATDTSADQLAHACSHANITYKLEPAESISADTHSVDLVVAAQAAHWFDLDAFYSEVRRIAKPNGLIALVSYSVPYIEGPPNTRFQQFYWQETTPYWPPQRKHVEKAYLDIPFPFEEIVCPQLAIHRDWTLAEFVGYIKTWSAYRKAVEAGNRQVFEELPDALVPFWGETKQTQRITWPITLRLGCVD